MTHHLHFALSLRTKNANNIFLLVDMTTIKKIINYVNNNFLFDSTKRERRQVLTVLIISILLLTGNIIYSSAHDINNLMSDSTIAYLRKTANSEVKTDTLNRLDRFIINRYKNLQLFSFDPNTADEDTLEQLGLTHKQITTLINFRLKGGTFTCKEDFRKLYGIRYRQFQLLRPFINLPEKDSVKHRTLASNNNKLKSNKKQDKTTNKKPKDDSTRFFSFDPNFVSEEDMYRLGFYTKQIESFVKMRNEGKKFYVKQDFANLYFVDDKKYKQLEPYINIDLIKLLGHEAYNLNTVTTEELVSKIGFADKDALKIISMRTALGGFYSVYQLRDCGIDFNLAKKYSKYIFVAPSFKIKKININDISDNDLKAHPLFNAKQAEVVIKYRNEKGRLMHIEDLRSLNRFDKNELKKIERYFSFK